MSDRHRGYHGASALAAAQTFGRVEVSLSKRTLRTDRAISSRKTRRLRRGAGLIERTLTVDLRRGPCQRLDVAKLSTRYSKMSTHS